ncbi:MAG: serine protein kinase PrkA [Deltaproteobacteria bacterium]|nr:serine protein kinase PrkA [Deltaproteobacteria bacterium]
MARETKSRPSQPPPRPAADPDGLLGRLAERASRTFAERRQILTYDEYLGLVLAEPRVHLRDASAYLRDAFDHHGQVEEQRPWGRASRFRLFDQAFAGGRGERLVGQEAAQGAFYRVLSGFVRDGRANRLILLHGPNGSSKTTFVQCIIRALEEYSSTPEGALYRFNWIFPTDKVERGGGLGFGGGGRAAARKSGSFAKLEEGDVDARLSCEVRDHPLMLLPESYRREVLEAALAGRPELRLPELIGRSGLCHKCRQIFDALAAAYAGDLRRVLAHVQVERYTVSRGYRRGAITIGPQMSVDAGERQITADRSLGALPTALQNVALFEPFGELVDGAGGIVVFDDLLKRPLDAFKYLLTTIEDGEVTLGHSILRLNAVLVATSNEVHLEAFRRHPEFPSFRGRLALIRVPYLREVPLEREIYDVHIVPQIERHVAPHAVEAAARWAVMTRLRRPDPGKFAGPVARLIEELSVEGKAALYAGEAPVEGLDPDDVKALATAAAALRAEHAEEADYEGLSGASPREVRSVLLLAAQRADGSCLSPFGVLAEIDELRRHAADYQWLQRPAEKGGFHDQGAILEALRRLVLDRIEDDVRNSSGLVEDERFPEMVDRYVKELRHWVKQERVVDKATGQERDADGSFMAQVEKWAGAGPDAAAFRNEVMTRIGAHRTEHPGKPVAVMQLFADMMRRIRRAVLDERRPQIHRMAERLLVYCDDPGAVPAEERAATGTMLDVLLQKHGYCRHCAREAVGYLVRERVRRAGGN